MKYTSTIRSRQFITANGKQIFINPKSGELSNEDAIAVAKSVWGNHLIKTGCLTFENPITVEEENVQRGMTIKPDEDSKKDAGDEAIPDFDKNAGEAGNDGGDE